MALPKLNKSEVVAAIVGAAIAGIFSMAAGMYSLTKSFEYAQNKEQLIGLRRDIEYLTRVKSEIDENTQTLLTTDYQVAMKLGAPIDLWVELQRAQKDSGKKSTEAELAQARALMGGQRSVEILELKAPREGLVIGSWGLTVPESGDISFELLVEVNDYFRRVSRINEGVRLVKEYAPGIRVVEGFAEALQKDVALHNGHVADLRKLDAIKLKNKLNEQIRLLGEKRRKISGTVD